MEKTTAEEDKPDQDSEDNDNDNDNAQTIRPTRSPSHHPIPLAQPPAAEIEPIVEDYSDLAMEEDEVTLQEKVADFKVCISAFLGSEVYVKICFGSRSRTLAEEVFSTQTTSRRSAFHLQLQQVLRHSLLLFQAYHGSLLDLQYHL